MTSKTNPLTESRTATRLEHSTSYGNSYSKTSSPVPVAFALRNTSAFAGSGAISRGGGLLVFQTRSSTSKILQPSCRLGCDPLFEHGYI